MRKRSTLKALTLIEVVTYLALFAFIFVTIIQFVITVKQTNDHALARSNIERAVIFVLNHFNSSFSTTNFIIESDSSFNIDNGVLKLEAVDKQFFYSLDQAQIIFRDNGENHVITDSMYSVTKLYFEKILNNDLVPVGVRVTINIEDNKNNSISKEITTSYLLR